MRKIKTLFDSPAPIETQESTTTQQESTTTQQESRITLNEIMLLNKMQAATRYNLGISSVRKVAEDCGAIVRIGRRVGYHRKIMDEYFENIAE